MTRPAQSVRQLVEKLWAPPADCTVSEWADENRQLTSESSAEPGRWHTARAEYQRGIMDAFTDPTVSDIVMMTSAQVGKSEILINMMGYIATSDPGPILLLQPTLEMAESFSKDRIAPAIRDTPILAASFADSAARDTSSSLLHKQFDGGQLAMSGANSPASLASRPIRILLADEIDRFPFSAGAEGDPLSLAEKRTNNFWNRKRVKVSTPTVKGVSRIDTAYNESDRRRFYVPCPHCQEMQTLQWANVKWDEDPLTAAYFCPHCAAMWTEQEKTAAVAQGEWRGEAPFKGIAGFHINELYSPWRTLGQIATDFLAAKGNPERLKVWVNTSLGEVWEEQGERIEGNNLMERAEDYRLATAPNEALLITAGVDVQGDRLEAYLWGYGPGEESWVIDRQIFWGNPAMGVVWQQLLEYLEQPIQHARGAKTIARTVAVDTGGLVTQQAYAFCRANRTRRLKYGVQEIIAVKGQSRANTVLGKPTLQDIDLKGERVKGGIQLFAVGVDIVKNALYGRLQLTELGPGFVHFSKDLPEDFYDQLTAEELVTKYARGFPRKEWTLRKGRRNEALDCAVYAYAAAVMLGLPRFKDTNWDGLRHRLTDTRPVEEASAVIEPPVAPQPVAPRPRQQMPRRNWTTGWR